MRPYEPEERHRDEHIETIVLVPEHLTIIEQRIIQRLDEMETRIMADLVQLVQDDNQLADEVATLIAAYDALVAAQAAAVPGTLTTEQQAQIDAADATLQATKQSIVDALTPAAPSDPAAPPSA